MTVLTFPAAARAAEPANLAKTLLALSDPGAQARIASSATADLLWEAHTEYWADGKAQAGAPASIIHFTASLHGLAEDRKDHWLRLARYAVKVEMKHWANDAYILHADEAHEILIDLTDYLPSDDDLAEANRDNRERWADLADTAAHYATAEAQATATVAQAA